MMEDVSNSMLEVIICEGLKEHVCKQLQKVP